MTYPEGTSMSGTKRSEIRPGLEVRIVQRDSRDIVRNSFAGVLPFG